MQYRICFGAAGNRIRERTRSMDKVIKMIGIDLDGTLLTRQKELTAESRRVLEDAVRAGVEVVPVTGRPLAGVPREVLEIRGIRYVITSNGANTYALAEDALGKGAYILSGTLKGKTPARVLRKAHLPHEAVRRVLEAADGHDVIREIFIKGVGYHNPHTQEMLEKRFSIAPPILAYINRSRKIVSGFDAFLEDPSSHVENISLMFPSREARDAAADQIKKIRGRDGGRLLHILFPWKTDLEITHVMADKWRSLEDLGKYLGITDSQIMALETADRITGDNDHDGAAAAIREALGR